MKIKFLSIVLVMIASLTSIVGPAEAYCLPLNPKLQARSNNDLEEYKKHGISTTDEVTIAGKNGTFTLPIGHLHPRPWFGAAKCLIKGGCDPKWTVVYRSLYSFEFWMPDGAFPIDSSNSLELRRCEEGRNRDDFLVKVSGFWTSQNFEEDNWVLSSIQLKKKFVTGQLSHTQPEKVYPARPDGLIEYVDSISGKTLGDSTYFVDDGETIAYFNCPSRMPEIACLGRIWRTEKQLTWQMYFPAEQLDHWRNIIAMVVKKLDTWTQG